VGMPNWCYNHATITCPTKETYFKLINAIEQNIWFETFAPLGLDNENHENGWEYYKAIDVWKTKWGATDVEILNQCDGELLLELSFETAWSPPTGVYSIMNKNYNIDVTAFYDEEGCDFFGRCIYSKEQEFDEHYEFPNNKEELEELRKIIGSELDDYMYSTWERLQEEWDEEDCDEDDSLPELVEIVSDEDDEDDEVHEDNDSLPELLEINSDEEDEEDEDDVFKPEINEIKYWEW
jgi:hypothetical protein